ncbi:kinesin-like protein KIF27 [Pundamilia nyererei]|uniref:Kinesin-like protein KIF27 n=1 Tax=Pundamilia nyererei TaxID=303518 RepID=A0A9Y3V805_9CICH|nr:PREDICTED: kinesin-like protein KIF27 [Pundamilia nyererei]
MSEGCVRVAVRIRPLLPKEVLHDHRVCVRVVPGTGQVMVGEDRLFTFDNAFGPSVSQDEVYESCVQSLVERLVDGENATVFCYGQTGSGKTYTLGRRSRDEEGGIIDHAAQDLFLYLAEKRKESDVVDVTVKVSYIEVYREELRDLLQLQTTHKELRIREDERGNTVVVGANEVVITSAEELLNNVEMGNIFRHTGTTGMNERSSRSHTILTLQVMLSCHNSKNSSFKSVRSSKLCLVDLAGLERAGKTGTQLKESAHINTGLFALGNVIRALSELSRNRHTNNSCSAHVPYRDAKITRLLRDSLGGSAHTLMVACVSPSDHFVADTLSVLQFASTARSVQNRPGETPDQTEVKSCPTTTWHPSDARLGELEYEVETLRELLKGKEREVETEKAKTGQRYEEGSDINAYCQTEVSEPDRPASREETSQYRLLAEEAAALLENISGPSPSPSFRERLEDWQERLRAVSYSPPTRMECSKEEGDHFAPLNLREELKKCQEALHIDEQLLEQKDAELRRVKEELEKLLQERKTHLMSLEEEKQRLRIQTEQLVNQQIMIDRLRGELMTFRGTASGATVEVGRSEYKRPHSVPLIIHSCIWRPPRKIHSSPPAYTLERVMAAFKMHGQLLLAEIKEKEDVYCPLLKQQAESKDGRPEMEEEDENDTSMRRPRFRRFLNQTWTNQQKKSALKEKNAEENHTCGGKPGLQQPQRATAIKENQLKQRSTRKARIRASATERRIRDLSINMRMKEELIKELEQTDKETQSLETRDRQTEDGRKAGVFARLSLQRRELRVEMYHSLQHMRAQRAQLQSSLRETSENNKEVQQNENEEQSAEVSTVYKLYKDTNEQLCCSSWLEEEEEHVLQKRAELNELEEELKRRKEVLIHREACVRQKSKLETKKLCSSQALSQDLLHVSMQLESLEKQLQRRKAGVTMKELEKERDLLKERRDALDAQLNDNQVLTVEETHSLLQVEEAIEALDAALEFKNRSIQDKQKKLSATNFSLHQSQNAEPAQLCDVTRKLMGLSLPEALELLVKYFNKVVCLRETERHLHLHCEELELQAEEQKMLLREMEAAMQRLALDTDRRLTQQHRDHQYNIQLLLQKLKEGAPGEAEQATQDRLQHLEKELYFYKSTSRQLKKKLRVIFSDSLQPNDQPSCPQEHKPMQKMQISSNEAHTHPEEVQTRTHIVTTYQKINAEKMDKKIHNDFCMNRNENQTKCPSSSSNRQTLKKTKMPEYTQMLTPSLGRRVGDESREGLEMTPVRLCRRDLKQITPADLQLSGSTTGRRPSTVGMSTESILEDSIEVLRNTDR